MNHSDNISLDMLTNEGVCVEMTSSSNAIPHRTAYANNAKGRAEIAEALPEPYLTTVMSVWRDAPTVLDPVCPAPDPNMLKAQKQAEIKALCETMITNGFDADVLGRGPLHYSLTQVKQEDLKVLYAQVEAGAQTVLWHDDSRVMHETYTAEQFLALYQRGMAYIVGCKIRSDGLEQYIIDLFGAGDIDAAMAVAWDTKLPDSLQAEVDRQVTLMLGGGADEATPENVPPVP